MGRTRPPAWFRLIGFLVLMAVAAGLFAKRGVAVGTAAVIVYGLLTVPVLLRWDQVTAWSKRHPLLDSLVIIPTLFLALAYITRLSIVICVLIALGAGSLLVAFAFVRRRAHQRKPV